MTLPDERTRAVQNVREFLFQLAWRYGIKKIPSEVRRQARSLLKHYPGDFDLTRAAEKLPDVFDKPKKDK